MTNMASFLTSVERVLAVFYSRISCSFWSICSDRERMTTLFLSPEEDFSGAEAFAHGVPSAQHSTASTFTRSSHSSSNSDMSNEPTSSALQARGDIIAGSYIKLHVLGRGRVRAITMRGCVHAHGDDPGAGALAAWAARGGDGDP